MTEKNLRPYIFGDISLEYTDKGIRPWRLPWEMKGIFPSPEDGLLHSARMSSGIRLVFKSDAAVIRLHCSVSGPEKNVTFDLTQKDKIIETVRCDLTDEDMRPEFRLNSKGENLYEIWLPRSPW